MAGAYVPTELTDAQLGYVTELTDSDVLFGRGSGPNDHEGNIRFRSLVASRKAEYLATNHRLTKAKIAREIVDQVFAQKGRFLKKMEADDLRRMGLPEGMDAWMGVDDDTIMEKAKQALRQNTSKKNQNAAPAPGPPQPKPSPQQQRIQSQLNPLPLKMHQAPLPQYVLDDLEPIPLGVPSNQPRGHMQTPSQVEMPPPPVVSGQTDWQVQQRQHRLQQHQQLLQAEAQYHNALAQQQQTQQTQYNQGPIAETYAERDSMMAYVPRGVMNPHQQQMDETTFNTSNNRSISDLPPSDTPMRHSLRSSIGTVGDAAESMDMSQLMSSFQSARISDEGKRQMASTETMGTIEPIPTNAESSLADMSLGSSTFSILKGDDSVLGLGVPVGTPNSQLSKTHSAGTANSLMGTSVGGGKYGVSDSSLSFGDLTSSNRSGGGNSNTPGSGTRRSSLASNLEGVKEEGGDNIEPLPVRLNPSLGGSLRVSALGASLGSSSLSILKGMIMSTDDVLQQEGGNFEYPTQDQAQEQYQQEQQQQSSQEKTLPEGGNSY